MLYVDSSNRDTTLYPKGSEYTLHLTHPVKNISRVDLVAAKVPNSMYNITGTGRVLTFAGRDIYLKPGFYSAWSLAESLGVTYVEPLGKFYFWSASGPFTVTPRTAEMARLLGFTNGTEYNSAACADDPVYSAEPGHFVLSASVVDTSVNEFVFLDILELRTPCTLDAKSLADTSTTARNSFAVIPMDVDSGKVKSFKSNTDFESSVTYPQPIEKLSRLTVRWLNAKGELLDFQGLEDNSFILRFTTSPVRDGHVADPGALPVPVALDSLESPVVQTKMIAAVLLVGLLVIIVFIRRRT
jgi:hypothetical protein